jgi:hypothetical protein
MINTILIKKSIDCLAVEFDSLISQTPHHWVRALFQYLLIQL